MREDENRRAVFPVNNIRVCIDRYENMDMSGKIYSKMREGPIEFGSCNELLLRADRLFDEACFPQAFQQKRTFRTREVIRGYRGKPEVTMTDENIQKEFGKCGTFDIIVQTRCKTGWQGVLRSAVTQVTENFQSEMELLKQLVKEVGTEHSQKAWSELPGS